MHILCRSCQTIISFLLVYSSDGFVQDYPNCTEHSFEVKADSRVEINVAELIEVGAVADFCGGNSCHTASSFQVGDTDDCARICSKIARCDWWSSRRTFESFHLNISSCSLFNTNRSLNVSGIRTSNVTSGHRSCSPSAWPDCANQATFIPGRGYSELWIDASVRVGLPSDHPSCHSNNCALTDRFHVEVLSDCTAICSKIPECKFWSVSVEPIGLTCWLRRGRFTSVSKEGAVSGDRACALDAPINENTT